MAEQLYKAAAPGPGASAGSERPAGPHGSNVKEAEVVDAEYAETSK
jgi:hypothetical protein